MRVRLSAHKDAEVAKSERWKVWVFDASSRYWTTLATGYGYTLQDAICIARGDFHDFLRRRKVP